MTELPALDWAPLSDGDVALRQWREADAPALTALCQDETIIRWTSVAADYSEQMARARISEAEAERRAGRALILAVVDAGTDQLLGACDLRIKSHGRVEVGYMLGAHARGRGAMTKAVLLLSEWAHTQLGVDRVQILAHPENRASIGVAERAGFQRERLLPRYREKKGRREDRVILSKKGADARPAPLKNGSRLAGP